MKRRGRQYQNLWKRPKILYREHEQVYYKKAMDALCLRADLQENVLDYVRELCLGMHDLSTIGLRSKHFQHHPILLQKILSMGRDLMDQFRVGADAFYLGVFLELRLVSKWHEKGFFFMLVKMIDQIRQNAKVFSETIKNKLLNLLKQHNPGLYYFYLKPIAA